MRWLSSLQTRNCDGYNAGIQRASKSINCDLFMEIFEHIRYFNISLTVRWMPSHLSDVDERPPGVSRLDVLGNRIADEYAGKAASLYEVAASLACKVVSTHFKTLPNV